MDSELDVCFMGNKEFEQRYTIVLTDYSVKKAAESYLKATWLTVSEVAKKYLQHLTGANFKDSATTLNFNDKESIMTQEAQEAQEAQAAASKKANKVAAPKADAKPAAKKGAAKPAAKAAAPAKTKVAAPEKAAKAESGGDIRKITLLEKANPKREGTASFERYALYKTGMTVDAYVGAGGVKADIAYDEKKGFIKVA